MSSRSNHPNGDRSFGSALGSFLAGNSVPIMFILIVVITFAVALGQRMRLNESILYPAFDVLMSLLQIIPIVTGVNRHIAPAVICIALMLILVSSLVIFRGRMLRTAITKYLHI